MPATAAVITSHAAFLQRLDAVTPDQLDLATPCEGWDVRALLQHVTGGNRMATALLDGAESSAVGPIFQATGVLDGAALVEACRDSTEEAEGALVELEDPAAIVHFPMVELPAATLQTFRVVDLTLHAWDLARALGVHEDLPSDAVMVSLASLEAMSGYIPEGMFGPGASGALAADASPQAKLLDISGRRP
jgi:uncharacterized protein (TIGR03086 family)